MKRDTRDIFKRLENQRKARPVLEPFPSLLKPRASEYPRGTIGYFADQVLTPVGILIEQLENAGVGGVTPEHKFQERHQQVLLKHLRVLQSENAGSAESIYENKNPSSDQILVVQDVNEELLRMLSKHPEAMYQLAPRRFEELVAKLFADHGYSVSLTKRTRDGGYDFLAVLKSNFTSFVVLGECKRYQQDKKVGVEVVRSLYGVAETHRANQGLIITSSFFTRDAHEEQLRIGNRIGLRDYNDLREWLRPYSERNF